MLVAGHKPEGQGKATKAYLDLQRKQFKKKKKIYFRTCCFGEPDEEVACTFPCTLPAGTFQVRGGLHFCHIAILAFM